MSSEIFVYFFCLTICIHFVCSGVSALTSADRSVPGPLLTRFSRLPYLWSVWKGLAQYDNIRLHRRHAPSGTYLAPVVRLGPNLYSIARPEKVVYNVSSNMPKGTWYEAWKHPSPDRWTTFTDRNVSRQAETRRKFQPLYSLSSLLHYESFVDSALDIFRQRLTEMAEIDGGERPGRKWINLHHWFQCYAFDVIGNITYGQRFGFLDAGEDIEHSMASIHSSTRYSTLTGIYAWIHPFLYKILEYIPGSGAAGRSYIMRMVADRLSERRERRGAVSGLSSTSVPTANQDAPRDFLDLIIDAQEDETKGVTPYHVLMMGLSNIIAGSDTTAVSMSSILYHLIRNPRTLRCLRDELGAAIRDQKMKPERLSFQESQQLPYLQACVKESLRLCPATGLPLWRVVPEGGAQISGHYFSAGAEVGINTWVSHYDRDVWGSDVEDFRPERWLDSDKERLKSMNAHYIPFGLGSRTCLGRHISYLEICKAIPMIVMLFDFEMKYPHREWKTVNYWFVRPIDFYVSARLRKNHE